MNHANEDERESDRDGEGPGRKSCSRHLDKNTILIYASHFLSSFGDRIWHFAVGIYLYYLYPSSLMLTAIYGLATCTSLFLLGAPVGRWVDKSKRLKAARITIIVQNAAVVFSATIMASTIYYKQEVAAVWEGKLEIAIYALIIIVEIIAELASMANKLVLETDWIVVLARGNKQKLAYLNATMRTINLSCKILAPFAVGHLLEWAGAVTGAIFIASWNVVSAFVEFYLLQTIFSVIPELSTKSRNNSPSGETMSAVQNNGTQAFPSHCCSTKNEKSAVDWPPVETLATNMHLQATLFGTNRNVDNQDIYNNNNKETRHLGDEFQEISLNTPKLSRTNSSTTPDNECTADYRDNKERNNGSLCRFCGGWKIYFSHSVKFAGLGLASLYMTVLCFDNVSIGYLSSQGVSAGLSGNFTAVAAALGILGSLSFPFVRNKLGKNKAGIVGFSLETLCLLLCVFSLFAPGSPFIPSSIFKTYKNSSKPVSLEEHWNIDSSIIFLVTGIVLARYGLWIADLSVTQIFQENVHEAERGVMGGVQDSLNQLMSLVKFCLTVAFPYPETFGYLICLSWLFVFFGWMFFMTFVIKEGRTVHNDNARTKECEKL